MVEESSVHGNRRPGRLLPPTLPPKQILERTARHAKSHGEFVQEVPLLNPVALGVPLGVLAPDLPNQLGREPPGPGALPGPPPRILENPAHLREDPAFVVVVGLGPVGALVGRTVRPGGVVSNIDQRDRFGDGEIGLKNRRGTGESSVQPSSRARRVSRSRSLRIACPCGETEEVEDESRAAAMAASAAANASSDVRFR